MLVSGCDELREIFSEKERNKIHYDCGSFALVYEGFLRIYTRSIDGDGTIDSYKRFVEVNEKMKGVGVSISTRIE